MTWWETELRGAHVLLPDGDEDVYVDVPYDLEHERDLWPGVQHRWYVDDGCLRIVEVGLSWPQGVEGEPRVMAVVAAAYGAGQWRRVRSIWTPLLRSQEWVTHHATPKRFRSVT